MPKFQSVNRRLTFDNFWRLCINPPFLQVDASSLLVFKLFFLVKHNVRELHLLKSVHSPQALSKQFSVGVWGTIATLLHQFFKIL